MCPLCFRVCIIKKIYATALSTPQLRGCAHIALPQPLLARQKQCKIRDKAAVAAGAWAAHGSQLRGHPLAEVTIQCLNCDVGLNKQGGWEVWLT